MRKRPSRPATPHLPRAFTPVPRRDTRHDGWTPERQRGFIAALADTGCVSRAARSVGMSSESVYALRRVPGAESFRAAWTAALAEGVQRLTDIAFERAIEGVPVPVFHKGEQVGERRAYNDRLLMFTLRHHDPGQYGDGSNRANAISPATKARLKREWAAERDGLDAERRERRALKMIRDDLLAAVRLSDRFSQMHERLIETREPRRDDGEYDSRFRLELEAFDRAHPQVRDYTDEDVDPREGWPAAIPPIDPAAFAARLPLLDDGDDAEDDDADSDATGEGDDAPYQPD